MGDNQNKVGIGTVPVHAGAKLTVVQVKQLRRLAHQPRASLAARFGISVAQVGRILTDRAWREEEHY